MATPDTPPVRRKAVLKKSYAVSPASSAGAAGSPLRPSTNANIPRPITMNDDNAEKAARRKSAHLGDMGVESGKDMAGTTRRVVSALAMQAQQQAAQHALSGSTGPGGARRAKRLSAVAPSAPVVSMEVMNTNFEEWMKLATDNVSEGRQ